MSLRVEVIAAERVVLTQDAGIVVAMTATGQIGVLPAHAPMVTLLVPGEVRLGVGQSETVLSIAGGYLEVRENQVVILANAAERAEEIDVSRAEKSRDRALGRLANRAANEDYARASVSLARAMARLRVAELTGSRASRRPI